ncbi:MAG: hypothetical protein J4G05_12110 [Chlorobi bacterium]|nr:hypothetical protein [Chlorobiota bacterium]
MAKFIKSAGTSIDSALFELESNGIADALIRAKDRGVKVRMVVESDYVANPEMQRILRAGIPVVEDKRSSYMHNKFFVVDSSAVWTGSLNPTDIGARKNNNNSLEADSRSLRHPIMSYLLPTTRVGLVTISYRSREENRG